MSEAKLDLGVFKVASEFFRWYVCGVVFVVTVCWVTDFNAWNSFFNLMTENGFECDSDFKFKILCVLLSFIGPLLYVIHRCIINVFIEWLRVYVVYPFFSFSWWCLKLIFVVTGLFVEETNFAIPYRGLCESDERLFMPGREWLGYKLRWGLESGGGEACALNHISSWGSHVQVFYTSALAMGLGAAIGAFLDDCGKYEFSWMLCCVVSALYFIGFIIDIRKQTLESYVRGYFEDKRKQSDAGANKKAPCEKEASCKVFCCVQYRRRLLRSIARRIRRSGR